MHSVQLKTQVGADGILQVQMLPEFKNMDIEVIVVFQILPEPQPNRKKI